MEPVTDVDWPYTDDLAHTYPVDTVVIFRNYNGRDNGADVDEPFKAVVKQLFPGPYPYLIEHWLTGEQHRAAKSEVMAIKYPFDDVESVERFLAS